MPFGTWFNFTAAMMAEFDRVSAASRVFQHLENLKLHGRDYKVWPTLGRENHMIYCGKNV